MSYIGNKITGFLGSGALTVTTSTVTVEDDTLFSADGNTIIGNESSDTLTIKANTVAIPNNLNFDSNTLFLDASNNRVGIGTTSPGESLEVAGNIFVNTSGNPFVTIKTSGAGNNPKLRFQAATNYWDLESIFSNSTDDLYFAYNGNAKVAISNAGNIGVGTTSPGTYDSRANNLVVGDSGDAGITIFSGASSDARLQFSVSGATGLDKGLIGYDNNTDTMSFATAGSDRMVIDSGGNAIFTKSGGAYLQLKDASAVRGAINVTTSDGLIFTTGSSFTERMRIDSSGNLLISTTSNDPRNFTGGASGVKFGSDQPEFAVGTMFINRSATSDGNIISFRKESSTVGSIGSATKASDKNIYIGSNDVNLYFFDDDDSISAVNSSGSDRDNAVDIGRSSTRFKDLYLGGKAIINRDSDDDFIQIQRGGTTRARIGITSSDNLYIDATTNGGAGLQFWGAAGSDPYITPREEGTDNDNLTSLGRGANRFKDLFLGGSVYLGGIGSANALNDYEEGTWTVTLSRSGVTFSPSNTTGYYTKIGRLVYFTYYSGAITTSATSQSGNTSFSGLPFTSASGTQQYHVFNYVHGSLFSSDVTGGYVNVNNTNGFFIIHDTVSAAVNVSIGSARYLMISGVYEAA